MFKQNKEFYVDSRVCNIVDSFFRVVKKEIEKVLVEEDIVSVNLVFSDEDIIFVLGDLLGVVFDMFFIIFYWGLVYLIKYFDIQCQFYNELDCVIG